MNSITLKEKGFADFVPLKELPFSSLPANKASILVLADSTPAEKTSLRHTIHRQNKETRKKNFRRLPRRIRRKNNKKNQLKIT